MSINFTGDINDRQALLGCLKKNLTKERYIHTLGVEKCAEELAIRYGLNPKKAALAGLLHDCAKCLSNDELLNIIKSKINDINENEILSHKAYHAPVGE